MHGAVCSRVQGTTSPRQKQAAAIRESIGRCEGGPGLLAMMDACKGTFGAKAEGVQGQLDGQTVGAGRMGPGGDLNAALSGDWSTRDWDRWPEGQR